MGFIYKIEVAGELYIGSTKYKYLSQRQGIHNYTLNNPNSKDTNSYLYRFCREKKVKKIICELIEEVDNSELRLLEQEYITMLEPSLNSRRAFRTEQEKLEQIRLKNKKNGKKKNKIKGNCPICNKEMIKNNIYKHIRNIH
tara:strand:- start:33 stop:455 length:423 start_codon:yes stop_codon:yes gene_type:complete